MTFTHTHRVEVDSLRASGRLGVCGLAAAILVAILSHTAEGSLVGVESTSSFPTDTITQEVEFAFSGTSPVSGTAWIEPWNPNLGISLDEVRISLTGNLAATALTAPGAERTATIRLDSSGAAGDGFSLDPSPGQFHFDDGVNDTDETEVSIFTSDFELDFAFDQITDFTGLSFPTHAAGEAYDPSVVVSAWREGFIGTPADEIEQIFSFTQIAGGSSIGEVTGQGSLSIKYHYTIPEPGTAALLTVAGFVLLVRPRSTARSLRCASGK